MAYLLPFGPFASFSAQPYQITQLSKSFPEHHYPFEHARHKLAHGLHDLLTVDDSIITPRADIRESRANYYIEIELPGVASKDALKLKWTNGRTLVLEAEKSLVQIPEAAAEDAKNPIHHIVKERDVGKVTRAFYFPVQLDRDAMTARLQNGVLEVILPKAEEDKIDFKDVHVEHGAA